MEACHRQVRDLGYTLCELTDEILSFHSHRTPAPLLFPPHVIAVASLYLAAKLDCFDGSPAPIGEEDVTSQELVDLLEAHGSWEQRFHTNIVDLEGWRRLLPACLRL